MANLGAQKDHLDEINLAVEPVYPITGAKLSKMTQSLAYKGIRQRKLCLNSHCREATVKIISQIQNEVEDVTGKKPNEDWIWMVTQHKGFSRYARYFLWMATHDTYQICNYWLKESFREEIQSRSECRHCGVTETMKHILTQCETPGQKEIWGLAEQMWTRKKLEWRQLWVGSIITYRLAEFNTNNRKHDSGADRLW